MPAPNKQTNKHVVNPRTLFLSTFLYSREVSARLSVIPADEVVLLTHPAEDSTDDFGQNFGPRNCEKPDYHAMTCVCEGVLYNFSSLTPPNGKAWSGEVGSRLVK